MYQNTKYFISIEKIGLSLMPTAILRGGCSFLMTVYQLRQQICSQLQPKRFNISLALSIGL